MQERVWNNPMKLFDKLFAKQTQEIETMHAEVAVGDIFKGWIAVGVAAPKRY
jgi:hypothetical protein